MLCMYPITDILDKLNVQATAPSAAAQRDTPGTPSSAAPPTPAPRTRAAATPTASPGATGLSAGAGRDMRLVSGATTPCEGACTRFQKG